MSNSWYSIQAKGESAEVFIFEDIGTFGITAEQFISDVRATKAQKLTVKINSYGGEIFHAFPIYNLLKGLDTTIEIVGVAASSASYIAMAGKRIKMTENSFMMLHNLQGEAYGEAKDIKKYAEEMEKFAEPFVAAYASRSGKDSATIRAYMDATTWFTAKSAKENGFADEVTDAISFSANVDKLSRFGRVPEGVIGGLTPPPKTPEKTKQMELQETGLALVEAKWTPSAKVSDDQAASAIRAARTKHESELTARDSKIESLETENGTLKGKLEAVEQKEKEALKVRAVAAADAAIADGRIQKDAKDAYVKLYEADEVSAVAMLSAIVRPAGAAPLTPPPSGGSPTGKTTYDVWKANEKRN